MATSKVYEMAVCLYNGVTMLDYQGPVENLCFWSDQAREMNKNTCGKMTDPGCTIKPTYLAHTMDPVHPTAGPAVVPTGTYDDVKKQFDIIMIPGGKVAVFTVFAF
ncbi:hypothetical protein CPB85DRAFT_1429381 [Mucidula mucida]|nr:hypothetical protein CPB85DRAFT_1429381 [Mucidula mucida]